MGIMHIAVLETVILRDGVECARIKKELDAEIVSLRTDIEKGSKKPIALNDKKEARQTGQFARPH